MRGRLDRENATAKFGGLNLTPRQLRSIDRIILTGCGTSWHAALVGEYLIEEFARIPVEVEYASELRYRNPPVDRNTLIFGITQSGETADTLAALREMKRKGTTPWPFATSLEAALHKKRTEGSICMQVLRWVLLPPKHSLPN